MIRLGAESKSHAGQVQLRLREPLPAAVQAWWAIGVLESTDNSGALVHNSTFSDSYARAFMIKGRDAVLSNNTFRRSGGIHIGPEQAWLEGDPGINNVTVEGTTCLFPFSAHWQYVS